MTLKQNYSLMPTPNTTFDANELLTQLEDKLHLELDDYFDKIRQRATDLISQGVNQEEIRKVLIKDIANGTGEFGQLKGSIGSVIDKGIYQVSNLASDESIKELSNKFKWIWEPGAEHCDTCTERNGQVKTYDEWMGLGLPGTGITDCTIYCKCTLVPA